MRGFSERFESVKNEATWAVWRLEVSWRGDWWNVGLFVSSFGSDVRPSVASGLPHPANVAQGIENYGVSGKAEKRSFYSLSFRLLVDSHVAVNVQKDGHGKFWCEFGSHVSGSAFVIAGLSNLVTRHLNQTLVPSV